MLQRICPKLPMRDKSLTRTFYVDKLGFRDIGAMDYPAYLILQRDEAEIHFFEFKDLDPATNYGQVYIRTENIESFLQSLLASGVELHPAGALETKPWGQREFSLMDPDNNLLTFGESY